MKAIDITKIPQALRELDQWVLWKTVVRNDQPTKVPFQLDGRTPAKAGDPSTWSPLSDVVSRIAKLPQFGIGFEFHTTDPFCGVDLDGCRNAETGQLAQWAREIILDLDSYAEVSPSETGVKLFLRGKWNYPGHKKILDTAPKVCDKLPAIEVYDSGRYFAVTGWRLVGPGEPQDRQAKLDALRLRFWPETTAPIPATDWTAPQAIIERARKYLAKIPPAISGQGGSNVTFNAACCLVLGFELPPDAALALLSEYSAVCKPPWTEKELRHKIADAMRQSGPRGYLLNTPVERFTSTRVPHFRESPPKVEPRATTLRAATTKYVDALMSGRERLIDLGLPELDYALGGGIERGEMMVLASRPSHGKTMAGLQMVHHWTANGLPSLFISEEMSALALGKRTLQFASGVPEEHWRTSRAEIERDIAAHFDGRCPCAVIEGCRTASAAADAIRESVKEHLTQCVVVDYAQLLGSSGRSRYEQITETSIALRQVATECQVVLVTLCQLNREIEKRTKFVPKLSDIRETGQLEQDADQIVFCVWPHRLNVKNDPHEYQFFIAKNRNRAINNAMVKCRFNPSRQRLTEENESLRSHEPTAEYWA